NGSGRAPRAHPGRPPAPARRARARASSRSPSSASSPLTSPSLLRAPARSGRNPPSGLRAGDGAEAAAALAREALHVHHAPEHDGVPTVVGLERVGRVVVAGERAVEVLRRLLRHEDREHLLAVEGDLDPDPVHVSHPRRTLPEPHQWHPGGRTPPAGRTARGGAARRRAPPPPP